MEKLNDIEQGYLKRWWQGTKELALRSKKANAIAIAAILLGIFIVPPWPLINDFTGVLMFVVLMSIARGLDSGSSEGWSLLSAMAPVAIKIGLALATFEAVSDFFTSGQSIFKDYTAGGDWLSTALQFVNGNTLAMINLLLNGNAIATLMFQSPILMLLIFMGAIRNIHPQLSLGYLLVAMSTFNALIRNIAPTALIMLAGEFVIRYGNVMAQAIMEQLGQTAMFASALFYASLIWFLALIQYQFFREIVEGRIGNGEEKSKEVLLKESITLVAK